MTFVSYAQNFEDVLLWRALGDVQDGFYIDIGASHPDIDSVTRAFYDRGWRGINVEPTAAAALRLAAARPRDVNLQLALGAAPGTLPFYTVEGVDTGLSTLDDAAAARFGELGVKSVKTVVEVQTLAAICRRHAPADIHFLKIDVEGAERAVLEGADFSAFRPWIVLVEATAPMSTVQTHAEWDGILVQAGYRFVWFDGLNRFYLAQEHHDRLAPKFRVPPNVFDNFLRAADTEWTRRLAQAETRADAVLARAVAAESRVALAQDRADMAHLRAAQASAQAARAQALSDRHAAEAAHARLIAERIEHDENALRESLDRAEHARRDAEGWLEAMRRSTSWRITGPLRRVLRALRRSAAPAQHLPTPAPAPPPSVAAPPIRPRAVHQFHSGTAIGDAITNAMFLTRDLLRRLGYDSEIFAQHRAPGCEDEISGIDAMPRDGYALIVRHSMGHDALDRILALPVPKILLYHNITPPEFLDDAPHMQAYARKGRDQLQAIRPAVAASLADSEYNALELRRAGFDAVAACPLLFDVDRMLATAPPPRRTPVFTILFVGRLARSKAQHALVEAFARFRELFQADTQLVLVGRNGEDAYATELFALVRRLGLGDGPVELTGLVDDAELHRRYAAADLYVSLSEHEGFGVPLIEAMAHDLPVLAWPSGAVPYTLAGASALLDDNAPSSVAARILDLARNPAARDAIAKRQRRSLDRWRIERHIPTLVAALARAGIDPPGNPAAARALADNMHFTVMGHVNGAYSLAEVNRALALALEAGKPGAIRLLPVEGDLTTDLSRVPPAQRAAITALATRPAPPTGPHVVISQHYPVFVPPDRADLALAFFFWEESLVPPETVATLNTGFDAVLAPSRSVAKALIDSGVAIPVRLLGHAPALDRFRPLRDERASQPRSHPFTFLHVSSGFPRKGIDVLLAAYAAAFRPTDDVLLVIKTFPNPHNDVAAQRAAFTDLPPIELIDRDLADDDLLDLYRRADVMVLPTRGEGFNLPAAEALAAGLRLIVTGYGGHLDILAAQPPDAVRRLAYRMAPAKTHLSTPFSLWAEPDPADLAAALREALDHQPAAPDFPGDETPFATRLATIAAHLIQRPPTADLTVAIITTWDVPCGIAGYSRHLVADLPDVATILADHRTPPSLTDPRQVIPAWTVGKVDDLHDLAAALIRRNPAAIVIQHQPGLLPWSALPRLLALPALRGRVVCLVLHNTAHLLDIDPAERGAAVHAMAAMSRVVVHTIQDIDRLAAFGLGANVALIPQGVPDLAGTPAPALRTFSADEPILLGCYGFFLPDKGILQLLEAFPEIRRRFPNVRLRLVNARYPAPISEVEIAAARSLAGALGVADAIEFITDFLPEDRSTSLLAECDLVILPYQRSKEGSSAALRSAMTAQVPIAVTPLPLFDEAEDAVLRLPGITPPELADGIAALLADHDRRHRAMAAAWRHDRHWPKIARRWHALLRGLHGSGIVVGRVDGTDPVR